MKKRLLSLALILCLLLAPAGTNASELNAALDTESEEYVLEGLQSDSIEGLALSDALIVDGEDGSQPDESSGQELVDALLDGEALLEAAEAGDEGEPGWDPSDSLDTSTQDGLPLDALQWPEDPDADGQNDVPAPEEDPADAERPEPDDVEASPEEQAIEEAPVPQDDGEATEVAADIDTGEEDSVIAHPPQDDGEDAAAAPIDDGDSLAEETSQAPDGEPDQPAQPEEGIDTQSDAPDGEEEQTQPDAPGEAEAPGDAENPVEDTPESEEEGAPGMPGDIGEEAQESQSSEESGSGEEGEPQLATEPAEETEEPAPPMIVLHRTSVTLGIGEKTTLTGVDNNPDGGSRRWMVKNSRIATVSKSGTVIGKKKGTTVVRVQNSQGDYADCTVIVKAKPRSVKASPKTVYVGVGATAKITPRVSGGACSTFKYSSSKKSIVRVNASGVVTGVRKGTAYVTVRTYNKKKCRVKVVVRSAPGSVAIQPAQRSLGVGQSFRPGWSIPRNTAGTVHFSSSDPEILSVNAANGNTIALAEGEASVIVQTHNGKTAACAVRVYPAPESLTLDSEAWFEMNAGEQRKLTATLLPEGSYSDVTWVTGNSAVLTVAADGTLTARGRGETTVTTKTHMPGAQAQVTVKVWAAPDSVRLNASSLGLLLTGSEADETFQLVPTIPEFTRTSFTYVSSDSTVATVDADGLVRGLARGRATITVTTSNGKKAQLALRVMDPHIPETLSMVGSVSTIDLGKSYQVSYTMEPATAAAHTQVVFSSDNPAAATVTQEGKITGVGYGVAMITAACDTNPEAKLQIPVFINTGALTSVVPARTTRLADGDAAIQANLMRIKAVENSAHWMVNQLRAQGTISAADASRRNNMITNAFRDYAFPWITPSLQPYWRKKNSEGGAKDFKPGTVYYGLPYISGTYANRFYNVSRALSQGRWTKTGSCYTLNRSKLSAGKYVGNDCSCFVGGAIWGANTKRGKLRTKEIAKSSLYKTIKNYAAMRPGDLLNKDCAHVVMFLYYLDAAKTRIMIIENGGAEAGVNTVHCSVYNLSWFTRRGYKVRRLKSLG